MTESGLYQPCPCGSGQKFKFCCRAGWTWTARDGVSSETFKGYRSCEANFESHAVVTMREPGESIPVPRVEFFASEFPEIAEILRNAVADQAAEAEKVFGDDYDDEHLDEVGICVRCRAVFTRHDVEVCERCGAEIDPSAMTSECSRCGDLAATTELRWRMHPRSDGSSIR